MRVRVLEFALRALIADVDDGLEYPDAEHNVIEAYNLLPVELEALRGHYCMACELHDSLEEEAYKASL